MLLLLCFYRLGFFALVHFAGQAMQALIELNDGFPPNCADDAYYIAQEMVVARAKIGLTA